ncbi:PIN domain-containing protein [Micromonospora cremea]|uniref:PIN domain-containing protein n=1 Tax=Micromonospora cremea TaxID=709881 RepID=A0A1N5VJA1_9ACTN|nr:PIN domain-containing protein [Micromonospora cremea]SIM73103.1 PIN domain-containing protein [Micromonospora cremea]
MLITPMPGSSREALRSALINVHETIVNLRGGGGPDALSRALAYLDWCHEAQRRLRNQVRPAELDYLVPPKSYEVVLSAAGSFGFGPSGERLINGLVSTQLDERVSVLQAALDDLTEQVKRFERHAELLVLDTNVYMEHPEKIEAWDLAGDLYLGFEDVHIIVPLVVVDELDKGKRQGTEKGYRAGYSVAYIDRITNEQGGVIRPKDFSVEEKARGTVTVEVLLDPPGHVRLPINDDEIVDRAVAVQALAGRPVRLVTYDTKMAMRGRHVGLRVHRLEQPEKEKEEEKQPRRRRGREAKGGDRDAEVEQIRDPAVRAARAGELINVRQQSIGHLSRIRREAMEEMVADGLNHSQIADQTGLARQRVGQLLAAPPADKTLAAEGQPAPE